MTSSQVFVRCRMERRVSLPVVLSPLDQRPRRRPRAKGDVFAFAPTEGTSSEDEDDLLTLFANLNMQQKEKLNELIGAIHEKDELLDSQVEFLIKENKKTC
jgi:hypothetical protein